MIGNHAFNTDIAAEYGIEEAIILEHIYFWCQKNKANNQNFFDGYYWTYNSVKAFKEIFYYMSEKKIANTLKHLEDEGLIKTGCYNTNKYDRTKWYAITEKGTSIFPKGKMENTKRENGLEKSGGPIPDINTDIETDINKDINKEEEEAPKTNIKLYGLYNNVKLTDEEYNHLLENHTSDETTRAIDTLSDWKHSKDKPLKPLLHSDYKQIIDWCYKETKPDKRKHYSSYQTAVERSGVDKITEEDLARMNF